MWELDHKESRVPKNGCFWTVVLEKTLESPLDCKEIQPAHPKENQPWIFIGRTDAEAETPILWPPDVKNWLIWKDPDAGKDWRREEKGTTEDEMVGWHHRLDGQEFEQAPGDGEAQGGLLCCGPWGPLSQTWLGNWTAALHGKSSDLCSGDRGLAQWDARARLTAHSSASVLGVTSTVRSKRWLSPHISCAPWAPLHVH